MNDIPERIINDLKQSCPMPSVKPPKGYKCEQCAELCAVDFLCPLAIEAPHQCPRQLQRMRQAGYVLVKMNEEKDEPEGKG